MKRKEERKLSSWTFKLPFIPVQRVCSLEDMQSIEGDRFDPVVLPPSL
jgi:hypothetical protein